jgi:GNAT superfamily N-acetyltransferase
MALGDVVAASLVIQGGSMAPEGEDEGDVDAYWRSVEETRRRRGEVLVADVDGEVAGVCQVLIFPHFQHTGGWCCEIESMHVRSDRRGQGIGAQLLARAEVIAREQGCYRMQLTSRNVREDAHRFYVANGFVSSHQGFKKIL